MKKQLLLLIICLLSLISVSAQADPLIAYLRWSPDGTQISYWQDGDIWLINADGSNPRNMSERIAAPVNAARWSSDGAYLIFWYNGHLWWMNVDGSALDGLTFTLSDTPSEPVIASVDNAIAYNTQSAVYLQQVPDGEPQLLAGNLPDAQQILSGTLDWSPDGQSLAFLTLQPSTNAGDPPLHNLWIVNAGGTNLQQLEMIHAAQSLRWVDNSHLLLAALTGFGDPGMLLSYTGITAEENTIEYLNAHQISTSFDASTYSLSPNRQYLAYSNYQLQELDLNGTSIEAPQVAGAEIIVFDLASRQQISFVPDEESLAYDAVSSIFWLNDSSLIFLNPCDDQSQSLWIMSLEGQGRELLPCQTGYISDLAISPDGVHMSFVAQWEGRRNIYVLNTSDSNLRNLTAQ